MVCSYREIAPSRSGERPYPLFPVVALTQSAEDASPDETSATLIGLVLTVWLGFGAWSPVQATIRHPAPHIDISPASGPPGSTFRVAGVIAAGDTCQAMYVTIALGAHGAGDVQRVRVTSGRFHALGGVGQGAAPGTAYVVRAFCDYASDEAATGFEIRAATLPRTGASLADWAVAGLVLVLAGSGVVAASRLSLSDRRTPDE